MEWILFGLIGLGIGLLTGGIDYGLRRTAAEEDVTRLTGDAEAQAALALDKAEAALEAQVGQLGSDFADYDAWYLAQVDEWNAAGGTGTLEDYIQGEQVDELGQYGVERARLESQVDIATQQLELARLDNAEQFAFGEREFDAGVTASYRNLRGESAAAAAMGIRGGTIASTVQENQNVRMEALDLYLDRITWARDRTTASLDITQQSISDAETIGLGSLNQALVGARTNFDLNSTQIGLDLSQYTAGLAAEFEQTFNLTQEILSVASGGTAGARAGFGVFQTGVNAGAWGYDANGDFWSNLQIGGGGSNPYDVRPPPIREGF